LSQHGVRGPPLEKWGGRVKPPPSPVKISGAKMSRYVKPFNLDFQESRFLNQNINKIKNLITINSINIIFDIVKSLTTCLTIYQYFLLKCF